MRRSMAAGGHFGCTKVTFDHFFEKKFTKWLQVNQNGCILDDRKSLSMAFLAISEQSTTFFFTKWLPATILDDRKSLSIAFLAISDQYATFFCFDFFHKMAAGGYFGWPKITFDRISPISDQYATLFFSQNGCRRPFWMTENQFWSHYWPFQINTQSFFFSQNGGRRPFWKSDLGHFGWNFYFFNFFVQNGRRRPFWMIENHFRSHFSAFQINTQLFFLGNIFQDGRWRPFWKSDLRQKQ